MKKEGFDMKDMTWIKEDLIAHRGFHTLDKSVPENTLLAFQHAIDRGYGIEMDINVCKDGTVVVFHDPNLKRLCGKDISLSDVNYDEIKEEKILSSNETIPTLKKVLAFVGGRVPLLIELKPLGNNDLLCEQFMEDMKDYQGKWAMHSFHPNTVNWFKKHHPEVIRGQVTEYFRDDERMKKITKFLMKTMILNIFSKPDFINYGIHDMPNKYLDKAMKKGIICIGYASRNQEEFDFVKKYYHNSVFEYFEPKK